MSDDTISILAATVHARRQTSGEKSYTRQLLDAGPEKCARKFGEEAIEAVIAGIAGDEAALASEAADVIYHLIVLLEARGIPLANVYQILESRTKQTGLAEKASRQTS